jgi:16S rRNA (cytidine1402-2'-O)-methyltransferase
MTFRSVRILKEVDLVLAEDTRKTSILLKHYEIDVPTLSYHQQSHESKKEEILRLLVEGKNLALVTDAGTPGVGDPGNELIDYLLAREPEIKTVTIPGPSSLTAALSLCGFNVARFTFVGFLPKKKRKKLFEELKEAGLPFVFFDSPYRILKTLSELQEYFGTTRAFVGQELTKMYERTVRGCLSEISQALGEEKTKAGRIRGEVVVIVEND